MEHAGHLGYYVRRASERGLIAIMLADCWPLIAPTGSSGPLYGTNPIAAAVPGDEFPIVVDMSTAAVTIGRLKLLHLGVDYGHPFCALKPSVLVSEEAFRGAINELVERTRELRGAGPDPVLLPGERLHNERPARLGEGLELSEAMVGKLGL